MDSGRDPDEVNRLDKYTYSLKSDKLLKLVRQGDYATAVKIADTLEWDQEKNFRLLSAGAEAYEKMDRVNDAIDLLLRAYEYSAVGKRVLYKLTELAIRSKNVVDAETFYKKYLEEASGDASRYVLRYMIADLKHEPLERQITILETYKKYEFEEEWAYHLAELYDKVGKRKECVALCDEIILWFGVGPFVEQAMELKEKYEPLTDVQKDHRDNRLYYENRVKQIADEMKDATDRKVDGKDSEAEAPAKEEAVAKVAPLTEQERMETEERLANHTAGVDISVIQEEVEKENQIEKLKKAVSAAQNHGKELQKTIVIPTAEITVEDAPDILEEDALEEESEEEVPALIEEEEEPEEEASIVIEEEEEQDTVFIEPEILEETEEEEFGTTKDLKDIAEITANQRQIVPDVDEPTKEIVITRDMIEGRTSVSEAQDMEAAELETLMSDSLDAPEENEVSAEEAVDESEEEVQEAVSAPVEAPEVPVYSHEHCLFLNVMNWNDAVDLAVDALEAYYEKKGTDMEAISKIQADKLNRLGLIHSLPQLKNKDLIIEQAGKLSDIILREILEVLEYLDTDKVFVLLDSAMSIRELKQRMIALNEADSEPEEEEDIIPQIHLSSVEELVASKTEDDEDVVIIPEDEESHESEPKAEEESEAAKAPEQRRSFKDIDEKQVLSEKDFIRYAEYFAHELECVLDDSAYTALEEEMAEIHKNGEKLTAGKVEKLIEEAAERAEKMGMRRMFAAKYNKEGFLIIRKKNF